LALAAVLLLASVSASYDDDACKHIVGYEYFDLTTLFEDEAGKTSSLEISIPDSDETIVLNMCQDQGVVTCDTPAFAALKNGDTCETVLTSDNTDNYDDTKWRSFDKDDDDEDDGVKLTYTAGGVCSTDSAKKNTLIVYLTCDQSASTPTYGETTIDDCVITTNITSKWACPTFNESVIITFIDQYSYVFGAFLVAFGAFLIFRGNEKFAWTIGIVGFLTTVVVVGCLGYQYILNPEPNTAPSTGWIIWGVAAVLGVAVGFLLGKAYKGALFLLGAWLGVVFALFLNPIVLYRIELQPANLTLYLAMGILGIALGFVAILVEEHMKIIATSVLGAYALARGLSFFLGGFPPETQLSEMIEAGNLDGIPPAIFLYFTLFSVLSVAGIFLQYRRKEKAEEEETNYKAL